MNIISALMDFMEQASMGPVDGNDFIRKILIPNLKAEEILNR